MWGGWSIRWYLALLDDSAMIAAALASLGIALASSALATVLGTMAALALTRLGRFRGRLAFSAMIYAPLVMPEVITGLSLLLLFVAIDLDRGFYDRHHGAHHAHHVLRHRDRAVAPRRLRPQPRGSGDGSRLPARPHLPYHHIAADHCRR